MSCWVLACRIVLPPILSVPAAADRLQDAVSAGAPLLALLGFLVLPLAWSVPEALVTAGA